MLVEDYVRQLEREPSLARTAPWATDPAVVKAFILRTLAVADSRPMEGQKLALTARLIALRPCDHVQVLGILAQCRRYLGDLSGAAARLSDAFELGEGCAECQADLFRRRAYLRWEQNRLTKALSDADGAIARYESLGHPGHDLHGNGLAASCLARGVVLFDSGRIIEASEDMGRALSLINGNSSRALIISALQNYAVVLRKLGTPENLLKAEGCLKLARRHFKGSAKPSQERAKLAWVTAMVREELRRDPPSNWLGESSARPAKIHGILTKARAELLEVGCESDAIALTADIARMAFPECERIKGILTQLREDFARLRRRIPERYDQPLRHVESAVKRVASWRGGARDLASAYEEVREAISALRGVCGESTIPCLLTWKSVF